MPVVATDRRLKRGKALILGAALKWPGASLADQQISAMWPDYSAGKPAGSNATALAPPACLLAPNSRWPAPSISQQDAQYHADPHI